MIITLIVLLIIAVVAVVAFKSYRKTLAEGCCGAGGSSLPSESEKKKLDGPITGHMVAEIKGMSCINCQNRVQKRLNKLEGVSAEVDYKSGKAEISLDRPVADAVIRTAILELGYEVSSIKSM